MMPVLLTTYLAVEAANYLNVPLSIVKIDPYELIH